MIVSLVTMWPLLMRNIKFRKHFRSNIRDQMFIESKLNVAKYFSGIFKYTCALFKENTQVSHIWIRESRASFYPMTCLVSPVMDGWRNPDLLTGKREQVIIKPIYFKNQFCLWQEFLLTTIQTFCSGWISRINFV